MTNARKARRPPMRRGGCFAVPQCEAIRRATIDVHRPAYLAGKSREDESCEPCHRR